MEENNTIFCPRCGCENNADFMFCKNCGMTLQHSGNQDSRVSAYVPKEYTCTSRYTDEEVTHEQMEAFLGKNSGIYIDKFCRMKEKRTVVSWHWPLFVLTVLLGPLGASFWFFYRKIYKVALPLFFLSLALVGVTTYFSFFVPFENAVNSGAYKGFVDAFASNDANVFQSAAQNFANYFTGTNNIFSIIRSIIEYASAILLPMFANAIYEKTALKKIKNEIMLNGGDADTLAKRGGVSVALATVMPIVYFVFISIVVGIILSRFIGMFFSMPIGQTI